MAGWECSRPSGLSENQEETMSDSVRRRFRLLLASVLAGGLLAGCASSTSSESGSPSAQDSAAIALPTARPSAGAGSPSATRSPVSIPGAYSGAGGPRPANATPITAVHSGYAVIVTPSKNITCEFSDTSAGCGIINYTDSKPYGSDELGAKWWVRMKNSTSASQAEPELVSRSESPMFQNPGTPGQQVEYGTVVYHGDYVCASEDAGLTCWNTATGHGAFMNRDETKMF